MRFEKPFGIENREIGISVSIGIAVAPENGFDPDELMSAADTALYQAKASGKSTWRRSRRRGVIPYFIHPSHFCIKICCNAANFCHRCILNLKRIM